jgi:hypothetical protein
MPTTSNMTDMTQNTSTDAPLTNYRIVGIQENWYQPIPDAPKKPGGSCWHCGTGIAIEVVIQEKTSRELHTIGTTCAERVGLSGPELKAMLAERYAAERANRTKATREEHQRQFEAAEAERARLHGEHGTESRYLAGCRPWGMCAECYRAAPHGTTDRFHAGECRCLDCIDAAIATGEYRIQEDRDVIVRLSTGEMVEARKVDTKFGYSWCINDAEAWASVHPKRRSTMAKKGFVEAQAPYLVEVCGSRYNQWLKPVMPLGSPIVDAWGEELPRPVAP